MRVLSLAGELPPQRKHQQDFVLPILNKYGTPAFLFGNPNPAILAPSALSRLYLESTGITPASASAQTIGLALSDADGAALGARLESNGDFDANVTGWSAGGTNTIAWDSDGGAGAALFTINGAGGLTDNQTITVVAGQMYQLRVRVRLGTYTGTAFQWVIDGATVLNITGVTTSYQTFTFYYFAVDTDINLSLNRNGAFTGTVYVDSISVRKVAGYHAYQSTAADEPALIFENGLWHFAPVTDPFFTTLNPASAATMAIAVEPAAVSDVFMGAQVGTNLFELGTNGSGLLEARIGSTVAAVTAASIVGVPGVAVLSAEGSTYFAGWYPTAGGSETDAGSFAGSIPTTQPIYLFGTDDDGTAASHLNGKSWRQMAQVQAAWTQAELEAVAASEWRRQLAAVA